MPDEDEEIWDHIWELWEDWKGKHGEDYFRLGAPSLITVEATTRPGVKPPAYSET